MWSGAESANWPSRPRGVDTSISSAYSITSSGGKTGGDGKHISVRHGCEYNSIVVLDRPQARRHAGPLVSDGGHRAGWCRDQS